LGIDGTLYKIVKRVLDLEETKTAQAKEITSLKLRVKKLEKGKKSRTHKLKRLYKVGTTKRVESSGDEEGLGDQEDASKQGRIDDIDADINVTLVNKALNDQDLFGVNDLDREEVVVDEEIKAQDKGKAKMIEVEVPKSKKAQIMFDEQLAIKLQDYDEVQEAFDKTMSWIDSFVPMDSEVEKGSQEKAKGSDKRKGAALEQEVIKKQKVDEDQETAKLKQLMTVIQDEDIAMDAIPLDTNQMLESFDREDLKDLYGLVKAKFESTKPVEDLDLILWGDMKTMFEQPHVKDEV
ncbi:hypothetical protein Tco_0053592, partial [Tanacetum coccineum]